MALPNAVFGAKFPLRFDRKIIGIFVIISEIMLDKL